MELFHPAVHILSLSLSLGQHTIHNGPNTRSKLLAGASWHVCQHNTKGEQSRVNSHARSLSSEKSKIKAFGNYIGRTAAGLLVTRTRLRSRSLVNRHRTRIPWLLFQRHFIAVLLSSYLEFPEASCVGLIPARLIPVHERTSSSRRGLYLGDKNPK